MPLKTRILRALPYALLAAFGGYLYAVAARIEFHERAGTLGPDVWPKAVLALLVAVCLYQVGKIVLFGRGDAAAATEHLMADAARGETEAPAAAAGPARPGLLLAGIALTALYVAVIEELGFFVATVAYLFAFIAIGGYRRWPVVTALSFGGTLLLFFFFVKVVYVSLPPGAGPFAQVTFLLMRLLGIR